MLAVYAPQAPLPRPGSRARVVLILALAWSVLVQCSGAWFYPASQWNGRMGPDLERAAWSVLHFMPWEDFKSWVGQQLRARTGR